MERPSTLLRRPLVLAAGLLAGVLAVPAAAQADTSTTTTEKFYADSGDACPHGVTQGTLDWGLDSWHSTVTVSGTLTDQPGSAPSGSTACADDGYDSEASFAIYDGQTVVASAHEDVDNGVVTFGFTLRGGIDIRSGSSVSEKLVIQVCRSPVNDQIKTPTYCGAPVTYFPIYPF